MEYVKLKKYIKQIRGVSYKPEDLTLENEGVALLRSNNISNGKVNYDELQYVNPNKVLPEQYLIDNDIFICASNGSKALVGKACQIKGSLNKTFGAFCKVVRCIDGDINPRYLGLFFQSPRYKNIISNICRGANINNLKNQDFDELIIPLYSLDKQQEIVSILDKINAIIDADKKQLELLDEAVKSRFIEMFGDLNDNPFNYPRARLGDICRVINGRAYKAPELLDSGKYRVLRVGNFFTNDSWYYSNLELDEDKYCDNGDLLFAWSCSFGPRIWDGEKVIYHYHIWKLADYERLLDKTFFCEQLNYVCETLKNNSQHGSTMTHFTKGDMEDTILVLPPKDVQIKFAKFKEQIDKSKFNVQQHLDLMQELLDKKMDEYFGGE